MLKKTTALITSLILSGFIASTTLAATAKCTVTAIDETTVTMDCGKSVAKLKVGDTVKVKAVRKKAIEGC